MFEATVRDGVCRLASAGARWLATGWDGGYHRAEAAYNVTVPEGFDRTDLAAYATERRQAAGFGEGPTLLTGVDQTHARGARAGSVTVVATAGLSNPAALPLDGGGSDGEPAGPRDEDTTRPGTVNLLVGTARALDDGGLATLVATAVEAKVATVRALTGFTGTTSDAVAVGSLPDGDPADFAGSATPVGEAARACVRDAVRASLASRYPDGEWPATVEAADHGVVTDRSTERFRP